MVVVLVLAAFDVDVGTEIGEEIDGGVSGVDVDVVDEFESGEVFGAEFLGDIGASFAFADVGVSGEGDDENVALLFGELEIANVAWMDDVEASVAVDDGFPGGAGGGAVVEELGEVDDLAGGDGAVAGGGHAGVIGRGAGFS